MDGDPRLMRVSRDMRGQISQLQGENQVLRGESGADREESRPPGAESAQTNTAPQPGEAAHKRRTTSASTALGQQEAQRGNTMTVRRYSISSTVHSIASSKSKHVKRHSSSGSFEVQGLVNQPCSSTVIDFTKEEESIAKIPSRASTNSITSTRSLQKYMYKCRGKVKAVTFLLPVDMSSYSENQSSIKCPQNQDADQLSTIIEKDP